jgi:hypothetical protein
MLLSSKTCCAAAGLAALIQVYPLRAQQQDASLPPSRMLATAALAGQTVAVLPFTLVVADPALESDSVYASYRDRRAGLLRADSLLGESLQTRGPEVNWVLAPQLRKMARRSAGMVADPDNMGQAVLRAPNMTRVPDRLRSSMRGLLALADGRLALVPASLGFGPDKDGRLRADVTLVLADTRSGKVLWRSLAYGRGASPDEALKAAVAAVLPLTTSQ